MVLCFLLAIAWVIATLIGLTGEWFAVGFWIVLGIGILVKGPVTPLITGLTILALCLHDRNYRWLRVLRPGFGFGLMVLIVLPWLLAIQHATHGEFLRESLGHDFGAKLQGTQESHGAPPGAYLAAAGLLLWPLFPLAWRGIGRAWQAIREDEVAAQAMGINTTRVKLLAFAMGASFGGVAGGMFAAIQGFISPQWIIVGVDKRRIFHVVLR